jgi:hypothetical protein
MINDLLIRLAERRGADPARKGERRKSEMEIRERLARHGIDVALSTIQGWIDGRPISRMIAPRVEMLFERWMKEQ